MVAERRQKTGDVIKLRAMETGDEQKPAAGSRNAGDDTNFCGHEKFPVSLLGLSAKKRERPFWAKTTCSDNRPQILLNACMRRL